MRIAIVNDMVMAVEVLRRVISEFSPHEIAWTALDGKEAVELCAKDPPDLILMDLVMPLLDGAEATQIIMNNHPCAILIVTASVEGNLTKVFQAMGYGALDVTRTPPLGLHFTPEGAQALIQKIATIERFIGKNPSPQITPPKDEEKVLCTSNRMVLIGASTGGPLAIQSILSKLCLSFSAPIVVLQHMDIHFVPSFVEWLQSQIDLPVLTARENESPQPGHVYIAGKEEHLTFSKKEQFTYTPFPRESVYTPSIDALFSSSANNLSQCGTALLLTGIGHDGAQGLYQLKEKGWETIVENPETCVIREMPQTAIKLNASSQVLNQAQIADWLNEKYSNSALKQPSL